MNTKDLLAIFTAAVATATLTLVTFNGSSIEAGDEAEPLASKIAKPKLVVQGVELSLAFANERVSPADHPAFKLTALNTSGEPADCTIWITLSGTAIRNPLSRAWPVPTTLWQAKQSLTLSAKETKTVTLSTPTNLPPNNLIVVKLSEVDPAAESAPAGKVASVVALNFSTATNALAENTNLTAAR